MNDLQRVCETIEKVRGLLEGDRVRSEADVRAYIVTPLLRVLGWDPADPGSVKREHPITGGKSFFFDYALLAADRTVAFVIEAKAPGKLDADARDQLLLYAMKTKTRLGLTTDGRTWSFYLPLGGGSSEERLVRTVDLGADAAESAGGVLSRYLARDCVLSGRAHGAASGDLASFALHRVVRTGWAGLLKVPTTSSSRRSRPRPGQPRPEAAPRRRRAAPSTTPSGRSSSTDSPFPLLRRPRWYRRRRLDRRRRPRPGGASRGRSATSSTRNGTPRTSTSPSSAASTRSAGSESFYRRLREKIRGSKRAHIAESPEATGGQQVRPLPGGWHINTHLPTPDKLRNLERACDVAGIAFGSELVIEIGETH